MAATIQILCQFHYIDALKASSTGRYDTPPGPSGDGGKTALARLLRATHLVFALCALMTLAAVLTADLAVAQNQAGETANVPPRKVVAVVPHSWPPQYEQDEEGKPVGFAIDVMNEIAARAGITVTYKVAKNFSEAVEILNRGEADLIPNSGILPERMGTYAFTAPVETFVVSVFVRSDTSDINGVSELVGRSLSVVEKNIGLLMFGKRQDIDVQVFPDVRSALFQLVAGQVDALVFPQPVILNLTRQFGIEDQIKVVGEPLKEIKRGIRVMKDNVALLAILNEAVEGFVGTPTYQRTYTKWYGKPKPFWTVTRMIWAMGGLLVLVLIAMASWRYRSVIKLNRELRDTIAERKRAEEALRASQQRLAGILDIADDAVISIDDSHRVTLFNKGAEWIFGYKVEEVLGEPLEVLLPSSVRKSHRRHVDDFAEGLNVARKMGKRQEILGLRKDGTEFPGEASISKLELDGNRVFTVILRDVTTRKAVEREIAEKSALLETTFESMSQGISVVDADLKFVAFNQRYVDLWGYPPGFLRLGMPCEEVVRFKAERGDYGSCDVGRKVRERMRAHRRGEASESEFALPNGKVIYFNRNPLPGGGSVTTYTDITERKRAEEALRESEARLVNAQRIARLGNWERNIETGEVHWSDQMYDIFAITPDQFAGNREDFLERVHPDDRELIEEAERMALNEGAPFDVEYRIVRPDTSERVLHSHGEVEFDPAGRPVRVHGTAQDITERKSLEEQIRQIQKLDAVGKLAGGVAHEFNNLLFVLRGNMDLLGLRINDNPELRQHLETMTRQIKRGSYLTHLLVAYASQQPLRPKKMNINDVIREIITLLEGSLSDAIEIDTFCAKDLWTTMVDRGELECAIINLAVNAQDAMPEGGKLTVETANVRVDGKSLANGGDAEPGEYVKLAVTDTGCGMAAVIAERAFEPFFTTKEIGKGTGLGLSMVYGFVKQSGGYVTIDSELAHGTTVSVYLPKAEEARA